MTDRVRSRRGFLALAAAGGAAATVAASTVPAYLRPESAEPPASPPGRVRFSGRVVLVTGGTSGIGEARVRAFAAQWFGPRKTTVREEQRYAAVRLHRFRAATTLS
ncbi:twin-arginine translocation signal domain-containing protein [Rhodococcus opacus]|uniref:twin-arginine translocation signal domain-containing protein n=1 Tax=Rhodococcus opacus TaxID=37919 RepID=UPI0037CB6689